MPNRKNRNNNNKPMGGNGYSAIERTITSAPQLAQQQALPGKRRPLRLPTYPAIERTAVKAFNSTTTSTFGTSAVGDGKYFALFRSPTNYLWESTSGNSPQAGFSVYRTNNLSSTGTGSAVPLAPGESLDLSNLFPSDQVYPQGSFGDTSFMHSPCPMAIDDLNRVWFYSPNCDGVQNNFGVRLKTNGAVGPVGSYLLNVEYCTNWSTTDTRTMSLTMGIPSADTTVIEGYSSINGIWFRPTNLICTAAASASSVRSITNIHCGFCNSGSSFSGVAPGGVSGTFLIPKIVAPKELMAAPTLFEDTRATAIGVLFSNVTANLYKEGTAKACRVLANEFVVGGGPTTLQSNFDSLYTSTRPELKYNGPLAKGLYTFTPPDTESSIFRDYTTQLSNNNLFDIPPPFRLDSFAYVSFIQFVDTQSAGGTNNGTVMNITGDLHIEFRSASTLWDVAVTRTPLEVWHKSQLALAAMPLFYENLTHMEDVARIAGRLAGWAAGPQGRVAMQVGRVVAPQVVKAAYALGKAAVNRVSKPPPKPSQPKQKQPNQKQKNKRRG